MRLSFGSELIPFALKATEIIDELLGFMRITDSSKGTKPLKATESKAEAQLQPRTQVQSN